MFPSSRAAARGMMMVLVVAMIAIPAAASPAIRFVSPGRGETLHAGQPVEIRWTRLGSSVEEAELLLTIDDQAGFQLRLTPQFQPDRETWTWVVPNLPTRAARIRIRVGIDGREIESRPSAPFGIDATPEAPLPGVHFDQGEWWLGATLLQMPLVPDRGERINSDPGAFEIADVADLSRRVSASEEPRDPATCPIGLAAIVPIPNSLPRYRRLLQVPQRE